MSKISEKKNSFAKRRLLFLHEAINETESQSVLTSARVNYAAADKYNSGLLHFLGERLPIVLFFSL